jgi:hypothetical protein
MYKIWTNSEITCIVCPYLLSAKSHQTEYELTLQDIKMNEIEGRKRYYKFYRKQLQHELDAMGYGKSRSSRPIVATESSKETVSPFTALVAALSAGGVLSLLARNATLQ